jgi:hypothetical protein
MDVAAIYIALRDSVTIGASLGSIGSEKNRKESVVFRRERDNECAFDIAGFGGLLIVSAV